MQHVSPLLKRLLIATAANLLGAGLLQAAPSTGSIEATIERALETFDAPGMAVSIVQGGELVYSGGHGIAEIGSSEGVDDRTLFQIGSIGKTYTATAIMQLCERGRLRLDWHADLAERSGTIGLAGVGEGTRARRLSACHARSDDGR